MSAARAFPLRRPRAAAVLALVLALVLLGPAAIGTARARRREDLAGVPRGSVFRIRSSTRT